MKKITLVLTLLLSLTIFAQKDELKTLKKSYNIKSSPSEKDILKFNESLSSLDKMNTLDASQKNEYNFYKGIQPFLPFFSLSLKSAPINSIQDSFNVNDVNTMSGYFDKVLEYENKTVNFEFRDEIKNTILPFIKPYISTKAYDLNTKKDFTGSSNMFYALYKLDKTDGINIENAAVLAIQAGNIELALKYYQEYKESDYLENGKLYYALNALTNKEELLNNKADRDSRVKLGTHSNPRDEKVSMKKPEVYKNVAILLVENNKLEEGKKAYKEAKSLDPTNIDILTQEAYLYLRLKDHEKYYILLNDILKIYPENSLVNYSIGEYFLINEGKIVDEMNANLNNNKLYSELVEKRKIMFSKALPYFETSYKLDPTSKNTVIMLRTSYEILGMKDKAAKL